MFFSFSCIFVVRKFTTREEKSNNLEKKYLKLKKYFFLSLITFTQFFPFSSFINFICQLDMIKIVNFFLFANVQQSDIFVHFFILFLFGNFFFIPMNFNDIFEIFNFFLYIHFSTSVYFICFELDFFFFVLLLFLKCFHCENFWLFPYKRLHHEI